MKTREIIARCEACGREGGFTPCADCRRELCSSCARFELVGSGCGTVIPVYFCPTCVMDPLINPNAVFRQETGREGR
ncbi:MAG: hypothetical protein N2Z74_08415 [Syntrophales bacterium]|nr:hypothetical protein [Syntrophales bacterium]